MIIELSPPTLIAEATRIQGSLTFLSHAQIMGMVEGDIIQQSLEVLQIGATGWVHGNLTSQGPIHIEGRVEGNVTSATKIRLFPSAMVRGTLTAPSIEVKAGAIFEGETQMQGTIPTRLKQAA